MEGLETQHNETAKRARRLWMQELTSEQTLEKAFDDVCSARTKNPHCDIWDVRSNWPALRGQLQQSLRQGTFRFDSVRQYEAQVGLVGIRASLDAVVCKAMALVMQRRVVLSDTCSTHLKGRGGLKAAVRDSAQLTCSQTFFFRSDVKSYYDSIDHTTLLAMLRRDICDPDFLALVGAALKRTDRFGEVYTDVTCGIARGCPMSPIFAAIYLRGLDDNMLRLKGVHYVRYMDDWVIFSKSRWALKRAVRRCHQSMQALQLKLHPDKTFIGRVAQGFDFLGYHFGCRGLFLAKQSFQRAQEKARRLYEQGGPRSRLDAYLKRWKRWATSGLGEHELVDAEALLLWVRGFALGG
tara:strand:- start:15 stop:1070 length:1056 start_codon:yes stop_codon:yes gene_type:complete